MDMLGNRPGIITKCCSIILLIQFNEKNCSDKYSLKELIEKITHLNVMFVATLEHIILGLKLASKIGKFT